MIEGQSLLRPRGARNSMSVLRISRCLQPRLASVRVDSCVRLHDCSILFKLPPPTALPTGEDSDRSSLCGSRIPPCLS